MVGLSSLLSLAPTFWRRLANGAGSKACPRPGTLPLRSIATTRPLPLSVTAIFLLSSTVTPRGWLNVPVPPTWGESTAENSIPLHENKQGSFREKVPDEPFRTPCKAQSYEPNICALRHTSTQPRCCRTCRAAICSDRLYLPTSVQAPWSDLDPASYAESQRIGSTIAQQLPVCQVPGTQS